MKSVMIVDDEPHVIRVLRLTLERQGIRVITAANGSDALEKLRAGLPDAMITDLQMPKTDGRVLCESVRALYPDQPFLVIVMTSMTALEEREWITRLQNVEFCEKPLSPRRLAERVSQYFESMGTPEVLHA